MHDTPYASPSKPRTQTQDRAPPPDTCAEATNTLAMVADTQKSAHAYSDLTSPFTCLAVPSGTGGRRKKVQDMDTHQSEDFWDDSEVSRGVLDTEDPLEPARRTYKPVCTDKGFIHPRDTPKLQASRAARIGMMLNGDAHGNQEYVPPTAPVEVGVVTLVVRQPMRGSTGGDGVRSEGEGGDREESTGQSGVKNFKQFRKNISAGIPRMVAVVEHVPRANKQLLQEWAVETSTREPAEAEAVESSQDLFRFQLSKRGRTIN